MPAERVFQLHLAGHSESGSLKIDSHDHAVCDEWGVWIEKSMYGRKYMGIARTTYLIGSDGKGIVRRVAQGGRALRAGEAVAEAVEGRSNTGCGPAAGGSLLDVLADRSRGQRGKKRQELERKSHQGGRV